MAKRLLLVDDETQFVYALQAFLQAKGFRTDIAETGSDCLGQLRHHNYDLLVLDLSLPDEDGLCLLRKIRNQRDLPVVIISGRSSDEDRIGALELGADDYMTKPFSPTELALRIEKRLHLQKQIAAGRDALTSKRLNFGCWTLDQEAMSVTHRSGKEAELTPREFDLLATLARNMGRVLSREQLIDGSLQMNQPESNRAVDITVSRLRNKLESDPHQPELIKTVKRFGYKLIDPEGLL